MRSAERFRELVEGEEILIMPVVHDALCAVIAERCNLQAICTAGYANSASMLGRQDVGLLTMTEMVDCTRRIASSVHIPVLADADTGYGGVENVRRTAREFARTGVVGMILEDQVFPKRCGHLVGKDVIPREEMVAKIEAALDERDDPDFVIMARTDALAVNGLGDALERAKSYVTAGADMIFVEAMESVEHMRRAIAEVRAPQMANMIPGGRTPLLSPAELQEIGYSIVAYPTCNTHSVARTTVDLFSHIAQRRDIEGLEERMMGFEDFNRMIGPKGAR